MIAAALAPLLFFVSFCGVAVWRTHEARTPAAIAARENAELAKMPGFATHPILTGEVR